jgi:hypothetical protein
MEWKRLTQLAAGGRMAVERLRLPDLGIAVEGCFELPPLARLSFEDQVFVAAFVRSHGSIKEMERLFGVSYPTVKGRLNRLSEALGEQLAVDANAQGASERERNAVLDRLERGEISARDAVEALRR